MSWKLAALAASLALAAAPASATGSPASRDAKRAARTYHTLQRVYYKRDAKLYRGDPYSFLWPFSQAMSATIALAGTPGHAHAYADDVRNRLAGLAKYWDAHSKPPGYDSRARPPADRGGHKYYDDNEWVGLDLVRRNRQAPKRSLRRRAHDVFRLVEHGWDRDRHHACRGGVLFTQDPAGRGDRVTISNGPAAELGYRLYLVTHKRTYRVWADRIYEWVRRCLAAPRRALYFDGISGGGRVRRAITSYAQGSMLGADALRFRVTGDTRYLTRAQRTARAAMHHFSRKRLDREPPEWITIYFEDLLLLDATKHDRAYRHYMQRWADHAWSKFRDRRTHQFRVRHARSTQVSVQAAFIKLFANLACKPSQFG